MNAFLQDVCIDTKTLTPVTLTFTSDLLPTGELHCLLATLVWTVESWLNLCVQEIFSDTVYAVVLKLHTLIKDHLITL